jgi:DNA-binding NtrC family response regulator
MVTHRRSSRLRAPESCLGGRCLAQEETATGYVSRVVAWIPEGLLDLAVTAAADDLPVLLLGESGVGKEILARRIHDLSARGRKPWKVINCGAYIDSLFLQLVFGDDAHAGLLEDAQGGTFLMTDVGYVPLEVQWVLLERADQGTFRNVRLMGDSNQDVEAQLAAGRLVPDFVNLFAGRVIHIPPLRKTPSEILSYASAFLAELCEEARRAVPEITPEAASALDSYGWPGNVRQLRMIIERALILCTSHRIERQHLGLRRPVTGR